MSPDWKAASSLRALSGDPRLLGVNRIGDVTNFAVFSRHAAALTLHLFDGWEEDPAISVPFHPVFNRTGDIWHLALDGEIVGARYLLSADGPWEPEAGLRFDPKAWLVDPFARAVETRGQSVRGVVAFPTFDWGDDAPPGRCWSETIIYEAHVRGATMHASSGVGSRGQYLGLVEKIPYLKALGVTAVELLPVQEFFDVELKPSGGRGPLRNYWGYNPVALFAPKTSYASGSDAATAEVEFKTMVREFHRADLEVILDVVFNHTAEGGEDGPTFGFRGLDNAIYYLLGPDREYLDFTGCGNTLNCNHPIVRDMIVACLRHWVVECHVDGFRFDLASILGRGPDGRTLTDPPLLARIAEDPILKDAKLIAEAWDMGGAFQVGSFPGLRWAQWNCHFRDEVRRFWRGDPGMTGAFATRLSGSSDLFQADGASPLNSLNFITAHDGFTINDLVSYARKHNEANGQGGRDGSSENYSDNNGCEGPTLDPAIESTRLRQIKNFLFTLFVSRGVPMLLGGDEFRRTQGGNNNAFGQDNEISWFDWSLAAGNAGLVAFVTELIAFRKEYPVLASERFYRDADIRWIGLEGRDPDWRGEDNQLGCIIRNEPAGAGRLCLLFNAGRRACMFHLPSGGWRPKIVTAPDGLAIEIGAAVAGAGPCVGVQVQPRTAAALVDP